MELNSFNNMFHPYRPILVVHSKYRILLDYVLFADDILSCQRKLINYYDSIFSDITLYTSDGEPTNKALHEMYVPMLWKKVEDQQSIHKAVEINSPLELFEKVICTVV